MKNIQLPDEIYDRIARLAEADHVSVDRLVATMVSESVRHWSQLEVRAAQGSLETLERVLSKVQDVEPEFRDRL